MNSYNYILIKINLKSENVFSATSQSIRARTQNTTLQDTSKVVEQSDAPQSRIILQHISTQETLSAHLLCQEVGRSCHHSYHHEVLLSVWSFSHPHQSQLVCLISNSLVPIPNRPHPNRWDGTQTSSSKYLFTYTTCQSLGTGETQTEFQSP